MTADRHPDPLTELALSRIRSLTARADAADTQARAYHDEIGRLLGQARQWSRQAARRSKYSERYKALNEQIAAADRRIRQMQDEIRQLGQDSDALRQEAAEHTAALSPSDLAYL